MLSLTCILKPTRVGYSHTRLGFALQSCVRFLSHNLPYPHVYECACVMEISPAYMFINYMGYPRIIGKNLHFAII